MSYEQERTMATRNMPTNRQRKVHHDRQGNPIGTAQHMSSRVSDKLGDVVCQVLALLEIALICVCSGTYTKEMPEPFQLYAGTGARVVALLLRTTRQQKSAELGTKCRKYDQDSLSFLSNCL
jgi:hypothetical protein